ncbi:hypothetical protein CPAR01_03993 [Colletotrichum paranaense]|uniref:Uncharacterized protein n=1 Tax=Colletotrichum paranaense TaxID=1914294 RepID=A0ABQ9SV06_9PEZI|nr:uncharacterized protein CPAR01_03993 [Colletotrichum paranaense]KAK1543360.1 hypothetical protein CPAR01_03993 [Colletotrichum paranaense]
MNNLRNQHPQALLSKRGRLTHHARGALPIMRVIPSAQPPKVTQPTENQHQPHYDHQPSAMSFSTLPILYFFGTLAGPR